MQRSIKVVSSAENFKKVQSLLQTHLVQLNNIQCDCSGSMDFSSIDLGVTIFYPEQTRPECIGCVQKAKKYFTKILFLADTFDLNDVVRLTCAGTNEFLCKEEFPLAESAARELFNNQF